MKARWSLVQLDAILPSIYSGSPDAAARDQAHYFGGPLQSYLSTNYVDLTGRMQDPHRPFGATVVVPVAHGRAELYGSAAGVFVPFASPYSHPNAWLTQASAGARLHLDPGSHLWVGTTAYYITDFADKKRQWLSGTADLTLRFGR